MFEAMCEDICEAKCLKCGGPLVPRKYIETWDLENNPDEVYEYLVCDQCHIAWVPMDTTSMEEYKP